MDSITAMLRKDKSSVMADTAGTDFPLGLLIDSVVKDPCGCLLLLFVMFVRALIIVLF